MERKRRPNPVARRLAEPRYRPRKEKSIKAYSRKGRQRWRPSDSGRQAGAA